VFDGAQGGRQLLGQLVPAQGGAGVGEVGHGLFGGAENGAFAGQFGLLVGAGVEVVQISERLRRVLGPEAASAAAALRSATVRSAVFSRSAAPATPSSWGCSPP